MCHGNWRKRGSQAGVQPRPRRQWQYGTWALCPNRFAIYSAYGSLHATVTLSPTPATLWSVLSNLTNSAPPSLRVYPVSHPHGDDPLVCSSDVPCWFVRISSRGCKADAFWPADRTLQREGILSIISFILKWTSGFHGSNWELAEGTGLYSSEQVEPSKHCCVWDPVGRMRRILALIHKDTFPCWQMKTEPINSFELQRSKVGTFLLFF